MTERTFNLVVPLAHEATDMRTPETVGSKPEWSGAVSRLNARPGDVESTIGTAGLGIRTSTTATRTTTTRTTSCAPVPSADCHAADFTFPELAQAYFDCRRTKRNSASALAFEERLERNLRILYDELHAGTYTPGPSICFAITRPKPREVWAAEFRDRIVHHLLHNRIAPRFYARFIADSCACIPGRGTLYAAERLEAKVRSITQNWSKPADLERVAPHKRLTSHQDHLGLPIGNLSSQFFANVYLDVLDQFVKHGLRCRHYIRYVDDFILLHESAQWLNDAKAQIEQLLADKLAARINPSKTILQPIERGVDFVGQVIKPWRRTLRRRTFKAAIQRTHQAAADDLFETANSYFGLLRQSTHSHHDRSLMANVIRKRGHSIKSDLTKTYRRPA